MAFSLKDLHTEQSDTHQITCSGAFDAKKKKKKKKEPS